MKIGDRVHFYPGHDDALAPLDAKFLLGIVSYIHEDDTVNLAAFSAHGANAPRTGVQVLKSPSPDAQRYCVSIESPSTDVFLPPYKTNTDTGADVFLPPYKSAEVPEQHEGTDQAPQDSQG